MSETATITVAEGVKKENGWFEIRDSAGTVYSTKKVSIGTAALGLIGSKAELKFTVKEKDDFTNRYIDSITAAPDGAVTTPTLGTGEYVKGKDAPETRAAIAAAVALKEAGRTFGESADNNKIGYVLERADRYFDWLMSKSQTAAPEKPSQGLPGASEQPASEGQIKEIGQLMITLGSHAPASPDPSWTWADELRLYTKANFGKESSTELSKAEAHQVVGHLEERITAVQAEAKIPF